MKLFKEQLYDNKLALEINADNHNELVQYYWSFINHGASNSELHILEEGPTIYSGYIYTTPDKLLKALKDQSLFEILQLEDPNYNHSEIPSNFIDRADVIGTERFTSIPIKKIIY